MVTRTQQQEHNITLTISPALTVSSVPVLLSWILVALGVTPAVSVGLVVSMVTSLVVAEVDVVAVVSVVAVVAVEGLVMLVGVMDFIVVTTAAVQYIHSSIILIVIYYIQYRIAENFDGGKF